MKYLMLSALVFLGACTTTEVQSSGTTICKTPQMSMSYWRERVQRGEMTPLDDTRRMIFLSRFNSVPPVSDYNPEEVILLLAGELTIALFRDKEAECVTSLHPIQTQFILDWLRNTSA